MSNTAILPGKFKGDLIAWLREFDACCAANGLKVSESTDQKILKLLAFFKRPGCKSFLCHPRREKKVVCLCCDGVKEGDVPQSTL